MIFIDFDKIRVITLVQGDSRPGIAVQFVDENTGTPIDISLIAITARMKFRKQGVRDVILQDILLTKIGGGFSGQAGFTSWPLNALSVDAGRYEGEFFLVFADGTHTVYKTLEFDLREDFA